MAQEKTVARERASVAKSKPDREKPPVERETAAEKAAKARERAKVAKEAKDDPDTMALMAYRAAFEELREEARVRGHVPWSKVLDVETVLKGKGAL